MKTKILFICLGAAVLVAPLVYAQGTVSPNLNSMIRVPTDPNSVAERVTLLENTVKAQAASITNLQNQLLQLRDQQSAAIKAAQSSATQAYSTAASAQSGVVTANQSIAVLNQKSKSWDAVAAAFPNHTHSYKMTTFGIAAGQITQAKIGVDTATSPPN